MFNKKNVEQNNPSKDPEFNNSERESKLPSKGSLFIIFGIILLIFVGTLIYINYQRNEFNRDQMKIHNAFIEAEEQLYEQAKEDDAGGETPQETLEMFIEAVESGDYELASDYFVIGKKEEMLETLNNMEKEDLNFSLGYIKNAKPTETSASKEINVEEIETYSMEAFIDDETPRYYIGFKRYPSGVWKITRL